MTDMQKFLDKYYAFTSELANYSSANTGNVEELVHLALGLCGEAGEVAGLVKKLQMPGDVIMFTPKMKSELGDVFWYWIRAVKAAGLDPIEVITSNVEKLEERHKERLNRGRQLA